MVEVKDAKLFQGLPESELRSVVRQLKIVNHPAGHEIVVRGENGVGFMVITEGTVTVSTIQGKTRKLGPGDSFGEMSLLEHERSADVWADSQVKCLELPLDRFADYRKLRPEIALQIMRNLAALLARRLINANAKVELLSAY